MSSGASADSTLRAAIWWVGLFAAPRQVEAVQGDLEEEFAEVAAGRGQRAARRWCRRQTVRTILHLVVAQVRAAPLRFGAAVLGGLLALFSSSWVAYEVAYLLLAAFDQVIYSAISPGTFWIWFKVVCPNLLGPFVAGWLIAWVAREMETVALWTVVTIAAAPYIILFLPGWILASRGVNPYMIRHLLVMAAGLVAVVLGGMLRRRLNRRGSERLSRAA